MRRSASFVVVAALVVARSGYAQDKTAEIDKIFSAITAETPGCAVGVAQNGKTIVSRAYGLADLEHKTPLTPTTLFDIGSNQKQFTAASILLLAQDGKLKLTDDIRKYLPELPDYGHVITINHLLTHTSGVRDWQPLLNMSNDDADVLKLIMRQRGLNFVPGDEWSYSSSGFELAKEIVARVSGMSFSDFTHKRLFVPLGMNSTAYVGDIMQGTGDRAIGYQKEGNGWKKYMYLGNRRGGGAIISSASDLLIWNDALTHAKLGKLVTEKMEEPATLNNGRKLWYGRGLMVERAGGEKIISHSGGAAGYSSWLGRFPDHPLSVTVLCNFDPVSATNLAGKVADLYLPPADPKADARPVAMPGVDVSARAGVFFDTQTGDVMRLITNNGRLGIAPGTPLVAVAADRFVPARVSLFVNSQDAFEIHFRSNDEFELKSMEGKTSIYRRPQPWTPTAADLQSVDGRYGTPDVDQVLDVMPGANGIKVFLEKAPDKVLEAEPVARDTYMLSLVKVHFLRDASGKVTGLEYDNPAIHNLPYKRLGDRVQGTTPAQTPAPAPVTKAPAPAASATASLPMEAFVGEYELAPGRTLSITLENGRLNGQPSAGGSKLPLDFVSGTTYTATGRPITLTFTVKDGRVTALVMNQNGNERTMQKVK
jgi:CubicO group peptidase (beta-lactamase class C family)